MALRAVGLPVGAGVLPTALVREWAELGVPRAEQRRSSMAPRRSSRGAAETSSAAVLLGRGRVKLGRYEQAIAALPMTAGRRRRRGQDAALLLAVGS